ncbi:hypothetical protein Kpol_1046p2 [Vanderwaltozyma polyspora DSM 70294]|uniref:Nucleolar protein SWM2 n=1 Tax=Vanderwaltozyma polyspora (strain ATCC 22028 / DSM 70294 / BCRC 21397 / CBS 2163 / NBRC 10782 / NRRL Y-8283 / UCD 57-17) TaxID=436907 RepID=SWM2_VANPO|nr:uncharacterized protein Kpol_1046p2 [Vanderwaltozyma polyspora DSM 70294]A7TRI3.1 RecName: Full=Nucleolar protein SWM2 [Vanderwaltozyma polyspora DSM 70294]EDO15112.1 hypothetical protein Kpol_1046p2 [Vanderwaltozyma polyspora DSM 70294]
MTGSLEKEITLTFLRNFRDSPVLLKEYGPYLSYHYKVVANDGELSLNAVRICEELFNDWQNGDHTIAKEVVQCALDMWFVMKGEEYDLKGFEYIPNLIIQEIDVAKGKNTGEIHRIEFHPSTNEPIDEPLNNLILEEVEVHDFI